MQLAQLEKEVTRKQWLEIFWPFSSRVSSYSSFEEARSVLIWRAQACFVNSIADEANNSLDMPGRIQRGPTAAQATWLSQNNQLQGHAAFGTLMVRQKILCSGHHPETQEAVVKLCDTIEACPHSLLHLASRDLLNESLFENSRR